MRSLAQLPRRLFRFREPQTADAFSDNRRFRDALIHRPWVMFLGNDIVEVARASRHPAHHHLDILILDVWERAETFGLDVELIRFRGEALDDLAYSRRVSSPEEPKFLHGSTVSLRCSSSEHVRSASEHDCRTRRSRLATGAANSR